MSKKTPNNHEVKWINAFYNPYKFWRNPIRWSRCFFRSFRVAKDRIRQGWSPYDVWDFGTYLNQVIGDGLEYLAKNHHAYPGNNDFPTAESWEKWLLAQAKPFQESNKDNDLDNPYARRYNSYLESNAQRMPVELRDSYFKMDKTIEEHKAVERRLALRALGEYWSYLWD